MEGLYDFFALNDMYVVLVIVLIIWFGIFFYLNRIDSRLKKIEKEFKN